MATPFETKKTPTGTQLFVRGSLDINTAPALAEEIDKIVATKPHKVECDLSGLDLIDSSGVAALVKLYKGLSGAGGVITIVGARDQHRLWSGEERVVKEIARDGSKECQRLVRLPLPKRYFARKEGAAVFRFQPRRPPIDGGTGAVEVPAPVEL